MKRLLTTLLVFGIVIYGSSIALFFFSKQNNITDWTSKTFVTASLAQDLSIANAPCDERRAVVHRVSQLSGKHFTHLIIGSSRVMQLGKYTGFKNALNLAVSGASFEDLKIILQLVNDNHIQFDSLHLDFNPWYAAPSNDDKFKLFDFQNNVKEGLKDIALFRFGKSDLISMIPSLNYQPLIASPEASTSHIIFNDGSIKQKTNFEEKRIKTINYSITNLYHKLRDFYHIDSGYLNQVFAFYHALSKEKPTTIYLSPFHPKLFEAYHSDTRIQNILLSERLFRKYCADIPSKGSFANNKDYIEVEDSQFLDAMHISEVAIRKLFYSPPSTTAHE
ncbi:MAG: hypothetical protein RL521_432 [Bacteroidota bacterium]|jgi:hypothetical protein